MKQTTKIQSNFPSTRSFIRAALIMKHGIFIAAIQITTIETKMLSCDKVEKWRGIHNIPIIQVDFELLKCTMKQ